MIALSADDLADLRRWAICGATIVIAHGAIAAGLVNRREQIEPAFADIVNRLAIEARMAIAASLREIIERAVKAELDALRARRR